MSGRRSSSSPRCNRVAIAGDGLDLALRFGDGSWHGTEAIHLLSAPLSPVCRPDVAGRLHAPALAPLRQMTRHEIAVASVPQLGSALAAALFGDRAAGVEVAPFGGFIGLGTSPLRRMPLRLRFNLESGTGTAESRAWG
nr:hypothetical protein [Bradyrhizobium archetypum]